MSISVILETHSGAEKERSSHQILLPEESPSKIPQRLYFLKKVQAIAVSRILYRLAAAAIICLCDQNPEFITPRATTHSLFGLAAGGVYHAAKLSLLPGRLLPYPFTLTAGFPAAVCSLLHFLADHSGWALPTTLLCGARTFLGTRRSA